MPTPFSWPDEEPARDWDHINELVRVAAAEIAARRVYLKQAGDSAAARDNAWKQLAEAGVGHTETVRLILTELPNHGVQPDQVERSDGLSTDNVRRVVGRIRPIDD